MRHDFPNRVDAFPINMTAEAKNALETRDTCDIVDLMYAVRELQKYVLTLAGTVSPVTTTTTESSASVDLSSVTSELASLSAQLAATPAYLSGAGAPAAGLGKNGDFYWDTVGLMAYVKMGGTWRQVA